jgi:hypothetical protein
MFVKVRNKALQKGTGVAFLCKYGIEYNRRFGCLLESRVAFIPYGKNGQSLAFEILTA